MMTVTEEFLKAKKENLSSKLTIKNYSIDLKQTLPLIFNKREEDIVIDDLKTVTSLKVRKVLENLMQEKGYTVTTINRRLASFKAFMGYFSARYNFPNTIHSMKKFNDTRVHEIEFIPNDTVKVLTSRAKEVSPKMYLIIGLLFNTGLRSAELLTLTRENIHDDCIVVEGKGGKMRRVDLNSTAKECIDYYLSHNNVKSGVMLPMRYETLRRNYSSFLKKNNIDCSRLHTARKSFATNLIQKGGVDVIPDVAKLLGHSSIQTLQSHYLGSSTRKLTVNLLD